MSLQALVRQSGRTVTLERKAAPPQKDAAGGQLDASWQPVPGSGPFPASIQPADGHAFRALGQRQVFLTNSIYLDRDLQALRGDRITDDLGRHYLVHAYDDEAGLGRVFVAHCTLET